MKKNQGITLVALVITIIVLLILAGVTITFMLGDSGILNRATQAGKDYTIQSIKEEIELAITDIQIEEVEKGKNLTKEIIKEKLPEKLDGLIIVDDSIVVEYKGYEYLIDDNYQVIYLGKVTNVRPTIEYTLSNEWTQEVTINIIAKTEDVKGIEKIIDPEGNEVQSDTLAYIVTKNGTYSFTVVGKNGSKMQKNIVVESIFRTAQVEVNLEEIVRGIRDTNLDSGNYLFHVNGESYKAELYNYYRDMNYVANAELGSDTADERMLVVKYHGNVEINQGVKVTAKTRKKGMYLCTLGNISNYGEISMTARGASAQGQNVYLVKNTDNTYEYIPAVGATGGASVTRNTQGYSSGGSGASGTQRATGGGGAGMVRRDLYGTAISGAGGAGTSYSGGTGRRRLFDSSKWKL